MYFFFPILPSNDLVLKKLGENHLNSKEKKTESHLNPKINYVCF